MSRASVLLGLLVIGSVTALRAEDWPQWMGTNRDGVWTESGVVESLPQEGLTKLWSTPICAGYSGPAVADSRLYVMDRKLAAAAKLPDNPFDSDTKVMGYERVLCLDATTGQQLWAHEYPCDYRVSYGLGPRCTPTVADRRVYTLGTMGDLKCLAKDSGKLIWETNFVNDHQAKTPTWGFSGHPLVHEDLVITLVGAPNGLLMAFNKETGKVVWQALKPSEPGVIGYSAPRIVKHDGRQLLLQFHPKGISALEPTTGQHLWTVPLHPKYNMSIMTPQVSGNCLFVAGYDCGVLLELNSTNKPSELWRCDQRSQGLHPINMTPLMDGDTIYGVDQPGMLRAIDLRSGKRHWQSFLPVLDHEYDDRFRGLNSATTFLVKHENRYFSFNERGTLRLLKLSASGMEPLGQAKLLEPTSVGMGRHVIWSHPAFARKCIFVRNDRQIVCFSLAKK